jgi:hypothetical protein
MLIAQNICNEHLFYSFSDSTWNNDQDSGWRLGCFITTYMGGIVDHSSNLPDPVALSSAEVEYIEGHITIMAASHLQMLLCELEGIDESSMKGITPTHFDSNSAIAMGSSYNDIKNARYIIQRYHYVRENIAADSFSMQWISTNFQMDDIGTKQTPDLRQQFLVEMIHIKVNDGAMKSHLIQEG